MSPKPALLAPLRLASREACNGDAVLAHSCLNALAELRVGMEVLIEDMWHEVHRLEDLSHSMVRGLRV